MSFYLRKSIKVGPLRYNLSKSGIGVSAGVRGFRVGAGPRGNYVHMGRNGIYFRQSLSPSNKTIKSSHDEQQTQPETVYESGSVLQMVDKSSAALLEELNQKLVLPSYANLALALSAGILVITLLNAAPVWVLVLEGLLAISAYVLLSNWDELRKSVVLVYDFDKHQEATYLKFLAAFDHLLQSERIWRIEDSTAVDDAKYHAGASNLLNRKVVNQNKQLPKMLKTNIQVAVLDAGEQVLAFLPDRLLVFESDSAGAISYDALKVTSRHTKFIESDNVPEDAEIVGSTWRYINKSGGPDRRFSNNPEYPVLLYEQVHFTSPTGLNELFQISKLGATSDLIPQLEEMGRTHKKKEVSTKPAKRR